MKIFKVLNSFKSFPFSRSLSAVLIVGGRAGPNTIVYGSVKVICDGRVGGTVTIDVDVWIVDTDVSCTGVVRVVATVTISCIVRDNRCV